MIIIEINSLLQQKNVSIKNVFLIICQRTDAFLHKCVNVQNIH